MFHKWTFQRLLMRLTRSASRSINNLRSPITKTLQSVLILSLLVPYLAWAEPLFSSSTPDPSNENYLAVEPNVSFTQHEPISGQLISNQELLQQSTPRDRTTNPLPSFSIPDGVPQDTEEEILFDFNDGPQGWVGSPGAPTCLPALWNGEEGHWRAQACGDGELRGKISYEVPYFIETLEFYFASLSCGGACGHHITVWANDVVVYNRGWAPPNSLFSIEMGHILPPYELTIFFYAGGGYISLDDVRFLNITYLPTLLLEMMYSKGAPDACMSSAYRGVWGRIGDPINTRTGGVDFFAEDISIPTTAGPLSFQRTYSSSAINIYSTTLGFGWTHNHEVYLVFPDDPGGQEGIVQFKAHSANLYQFLIVGEGEYQAYPGLCGQLIQNAGPPLTYTMTDQGQRVYTFDEDGTLLTWSDARGHSLTYNYDLSGSLSRVSDETALRYLDFNYDSQGLLQSVRDHTGRELSYRYDAYGNLEEVDDLLNGTWTYAYDDHLLTEVVNPDGFTVERNVFDDQGRATHQYNGEDELIVELIYNPDGTTTVLDAYGNSETHTYNPRNTLTGITNAGGGETNKVYDVNFRPVWITDENENRTSLKWSDDGANLSEVEDAAGNLTNFTYDDLNNLTQIEDPHGFTTDYDYDGTLLKSVTDPYSNVTSYTYTSAIDSPAPPGLIKTVTDKLGNTTSYTYNQFGQRTSITDALGNTTLYRYDDLGRIIEIEDPLGRITHNDYDDAGQLIQVTRNYNSAHPQNFENQYNIITDYDYDHSGNVITVTDTLGRDTKYEYDQANRLIATIENYTGGAPATEDTNIRTETRYDETGNPIAMIDPLNTITRTYYDEIDRPTIVVQNMNDWPIDNPSPPSFNPQFPDKNVITQTIYDSAGNIIQSIDPLSLITHVCYDELNRPVKTIRNPSLSDPCPNYEPGANTNEDIIASTVYDSVGNAIASINPNGVITRTYFDVLSRPIYVVQNLTGQSIDSHIPPSYSPEYPDQNVRTQYVYDTGGNRIAVIDTLGVITRTYFDGLNRPNITVQNLTGWTVDNPSPPPFNPTNPDENVRAETVFDDGGNPIATIDPLGIITRTYYDALNRPEVIVQNLTGQLIDEPLPPGFDPAYPDRNVSQDTVYGPLDNINEIIDTLGLSTHFEYDQFNRRTATVANYQQGVPAGVDINVRTELIFDAAGNLLVISDPNQHTTNYEYDGIYRGTAIIDPNGNKNSTAYDALGNIIETSDGLGHKTTFQFDSMGRLTTLVDPLGNAVNHTFDRVGNRITTEDGNGIVTNYTYDDLDRLVIITENNRPGFLSDQETNVHTDYVYDGVGNRLVIVDGLSNETTFGFDALYRLIWESDPMGNTTQYEYNAAGDRIEQVGANGLTTVYKYDALHRLAEINYPHPDSEVTFVYNGSGNQMSMTDGVGTTDWIYDSLGRPISIADPFGETVEYRYDASGNRTDLIYPDGKTVQYRYDQGNRLSEVIDWDQNQTTYWYDKANQLISTFLPNGVTSNYAYDFAGNLSYVSHTTNEGPLASYDYTNDAVGNRTQVIELVLLPNEAPEWSYYVFLPSVYGSSQDQGEDISENSSVFVGDTNPTTITYDYDPLNRLKAADYSSGEFFHYAYDALGNRQTQETLSGINSYTYDDANRLIEVDGVTYSWDANGNLLNDGERTFTYDHANRLIALNDDGATYSFAYNGLGDRLVQRVDGVPTNYTLDLNSGLTQALDDGTNTYLYGIGRIGEQQLAVWTYHLPDALGSVRQLADPSSALTLAKSYEPFGSVLNNVGGGQTTYGFTGEWTDETGYIYLRARYYASGLGRFFQRDPSSMYSNPYTYVKGNPLSFTDPTGMWRWRVTSGSLYHDLVENHYEGTVGGVFNPLKQLEYTIPGSRRRPDMFNSISGDVYEVEPWYLMNSSRHGTAQANQYVLQLQSTATRGSLSGSHYFVNYNWNPTRFRLGTGLDWPGKFRSRMPGFGLVHLVADYASPGLVVYWLEPNANGLAVIAASLPLIVPNKRLVRPQNWLPGKPAYQPAHVISIAEACGYILIRVGGAIIVLTLAEDVITGGLGTIDDIVTVPGGLLLIDIGNRLAVPVETIIR